jgi:hypothetical protein
MLRKMRKGPMSRRVELSHEAKLEQALARGEFGLDHGQCFRRAHCQRLFAQHWLACVDAMPRQRRVKAIRHRDDHRVHVRVIDQRVAVGEAQVRTRLRRDRVHAGVVQVHECDDLNPGHFTRQVARMASTHAAHTDHADIENVCVAAAAAVRGMIRLCCVHESSPL